MEENIMISNINKVKYNQNVKVSVIMACYNAEKWLQESIDSILNQTYKNFELIIVNDASNDNSKEIIEKNALSDSRIIHIENLTNQGPAISRNIAIEKSKGDWIAILDADDLASYDRLEVQLNKVIENDLVMVGSDFNLINASTSTVSAYKVPVSKKKLLENLEYGRRFPPHSSIIYKADVIKKIGGFDSRYERSQDKDLWFKFFDFGGVSSIPKPLCTIRKHDDNISKTDGGEKQIFYGIIATTSHFLRKDFNVDPSKGMSDEEWTVFNKWVWKKLRSRNYFKKISLINSLKNEIHYNRKVSIKFITVLLKFIFNGGYFLIKRNIFGDTIGKDLASEWISK